MKAHVEQDFVSGRLKVWLWQETPHGIAQYYPHTDAAHLVERGRDALMQEPSLTLEREALEALLRESQGFVSSTDATTAHLSDAVQVRDRLLTLVEGFAKPPRVAAGPPIAGEHV